MTPNRTRRLGHGAPQFQRKAQKGRYPVGLGLRRTLRSDQNITHQITENTGLQPVEQRVNHYDTPTASPSGHGINSRPGLAKWEGVPGWGGAGGLGQPIRGSLKGLCLALVGLDIGGDDVGAGHFAQVDAL